MAIQWKKVAFAADIVSDTAYGTSWDGVTDVAPSKNAVYDEVELINYEGIRKNYIINGNFDLWNYGTSQTTSGSFSADRWFCSHAAITSKTASQQAFALGQTDVPGEPVWFMRQEVTTASAANEYCILTQRVYGVNTLAGKTVTLSFYAKADAVKNISIEFYQNFGTGGSAAVAAIGVDKFGLTTNWARYTVTADITSISGKTVGPLNYLEVVFWFTCGSDRAARTDSLGNQSGTFDIANVALVEGADLAPLVKSVSEEQALCQIIPQAAETVLANATGGVAVPTALALAEQTVLGRITGGHLVGLSVAQIKALIDIDITTIGDGNIEINRGGSGNRNAFIDFHGDDTYTDFGLRIIRTDAGADAPSSIQHRGTGELSLKASEAGTISFYTTNTARMTIASGGTVSLAYQPLFHAHVTATVENCTGVNNLLTHYTLRSTSSPACNWTEITDRATNFSGGTFTAPVTGNYLFTGFIELIGLSDNTSWTIFYLITSNRTYTVTNINSFGIQSLGNVGYGFSVIADMDTADTAYLEIVVYDGTNAKTVDITTSTHFQGYLLP